MKIKKLTLTKETIAQLSNNEMQSVQGGESAIAFCFSMVTYECKCDVIVYKSQECFVITAAGQTCVPYVCLTERYCGGTYQQNCTPF